MANMNRRDVLRYGAAGAIAVGAAAAGFQGLAAASPTTDQGKTAAPDPRDFDEVYKGKKIKGKHNGNGSGKRELHINNKKLAVTTISTLFIPEDGSEPYVGFGYISALNHYDPVEFDDGKHKDGLKKLAKKVVDNLGDFDLSDEAAQEHHH